MIRHMYPEERCSVCKKEDKDCIEIKTKYTEQICLQCAEKISQEFLVSALEFFRRLYENQNAQ